MKGLLDEDKEFKRLFEAAKELAKSDFGNFSTIPIPYQPFVKRYVHERRHAKPAASDPKK